jgi:Chaperone of endosialidase
MARFGYCTVLACASAFLLSMPAQADSQGGLDIGSSDATYAVPGIEVGGFISGDGTVSINSGQCKIVFPDVQAACASDRRLKRDIQQIATTEAGIKLYSYKYIESIDASGATYVGVMAQDLEKDHADALVVRPDGYYAVRYDRLGLRLTTLANWQRDGLESVTLPRQFRMLRTVFNRLRIAGDF